MLNRPAGGKPEEHAALPAVRKWAVEQLGEFGPEANAALPAQSARIKADFATDVAPFVTAMAAVGLDVVPELAELLTRAEPKVRIAAAYSFAPIVPACRSKATPLLRRAIEAEEDDEVKRALLDALGAVNPAEAVKLGWQRRADADDEHAVPIRVVSSGGRLERVRPIPPQSTYHYTPVPTPIFLPRPHTLPVRSPVRPTPICRPPIRIR